MRPTPAGEIPAVTLRRRLKWAREDAGLTQQQLADQLQIHRATVNSFETGRRTPSHPVIVAWALACGVDAGWLQGRPDEQGGNNDKTAAARRRMTALQGIVTPIAVAVTALGGQLTGT